MPINEHPMQALAHFLPDNSFQPIVAYLNHYKVHLTVTKKRKTVLGNYRHAGFQSNHQITINGNLNKYEFLITLLHELAHLLAFEQYGKNIDAHGKEWKNIYSSLLIDFVEKQIFPTDIKQALQKSIVNPSATASGETDLLRVLRNYSEKKKDGFTIIEELPIGSLFSIENGKVFRKIEKRRKRIVCIEISTGLTFLFNPVVEVKILE